MALDFIAGCIGGCAGVIVGHPLDTIKVCLQTQDSKNPKYSGTFQCLRSIFAKEGMRGLFKGVTSPLVGVAGINAIVFGVYGNTQRCMKDPESLVSHGIAGALAGFVQSFICSPMELAKSTMQVGNIHSKDPLDCLKFIYKNKGISGLFRGLNLTILREVPAFSTYFLTYELLTRRNDDLPVSTFSMLMGGGMAGVMSWALVYPVDVLKSRFQIDGITSTKYLSSYDCLVKSVRAEGVSCLFQGITPTLIRAFPVNAVTFTVVTWSMKLLEDVNINQQVRNSEVMIGKCADAMSMSTVEQVIVAII
ncbi:mitochondrial basic amino acids transporter-like [Anthonomus grandis grandis]|uniref:mitochondrial basic amino acids transporter-like n=1 Tax=Anthonomus grandis grandis TaxID=2921223 RepID=UPI0021665B7B|nr:mitochondrial basic amino acids transporter-like [Anthonomus grandis grandis]XP_050313772.1 mitochondrial basic amino acids transporter-like [Anthonomus grandis grandis]XP_050313773.1 mitochondrial basic amino acids transporter-like [Anthonomus grandis grandis]